MSDATPATPRGSTGREAPKTAIRSFSEEEKESFRSLSASMSFVGVCLMLFAGLFATFALVALYAGYPATAAGLALAAVTHAPSGWWSMSGGRALSSIVRTRGGDFGHLMEGVRQLRWLFGFARVLIVLQTLALTAAAGAFVWCSLVADKGGHCAAAFG